MNGTMQVSKRKIEVMWDALRLTNNIYKCHRKETAYDRTVMRAYGYAEEIVKSEKFSQRCEHPRRIYISELEKDLCLNCEQIIEL